MEFRQARTGFQLQTRPESMESDTKSLPQQTIRYHQLTPLELIPPVPFSQGSFQYRQVVAYALQRYGREFSQIRAGNCEFRPDEQSDR